MALRSDYLAAVEWPRDWHAVAEPPGRFAPVIDSHAFLFEAVILGALQRAPLTGGV